MKIILQKAVVAGIILATCATVHATILYNDSTTDTGNTLNFVNGQTIGNEVKLGAGIPAASLTNFSFEIYSTLATFTGVNVQMEVYLYANDGTPFNGYPTPSTSLYDSGR
jgi:hypothetical protein